MEDSKKEKYREGPHIPVRSNRRTNFVRMSEMHGDKLPELRNVEKPEFSNRTRHFNGLVKTHMWKDVHLMYKEHVIAMNKVKRGQDQVFKMLCKVTRAKRVVQREEYARRQADARTKFTSQRMLLFIRKVVQKFKENVIRKQTLRAEEEKRTSIVQDSTSKRNPMILKANGGGNGTLTSNNATDIAEMKKLKNESHNVELNIKTQDANISNGSDNGNKNTDKHQTRSLSAEGNKKRKPLYTVQTAENRERYQTSILDTKPSSPSKEDKSAELQMGRLPTKAVEVSKDTEHHVRLKRLGSDQEEFFKYCIKKGSPKTSEYVSSNAETTAIDSRQVSFAIENENSLTDSDTDDSPPPPVNPRINRGRRKSLFEPLGPEDDEYRDFGWFTYGNPKKEKKANTFDTDSFAYSRASSESRASRASRASRVSTEKQKSVMFQDEVQYNGDKAVPDIPKENDVQYSLPPLRTRKVATVGDPPLNLLLEVNLDKTKVSPSDDSDVNELGTSTSNQKQTYDELDKTRSCQLETVKQDPRLVKRKVDFESTNNINTINKNGDDFAIWYPVSSKERKTYFIEPLKNSKKTSLQVMESNSAEDKTLEQPAAKAAVKRKDKHKEVTTRESRILEEDMSANYAWVLKQEEKNRNSRQARILDKEDVRHYKFVTHNKLVSELVHRDASKFIPPSHKELYLQKKLERKNQDDILKQRIKMAHFHRTITVGFELDKTPKRPSEAHSPTAQSVQSVTTNVQDFSRLPNLTFDIFKDEGQRLADEDSMTRIRYIRNDIKFMTPRKRGGRRTSMWNLQDPSKLKIFKGYA